MKWIYYNIFPICLLAMTVYMIEKGVGYWGWPLAGAMICGVVPRTYERQSKKLDDDE